MHQCPQVVFRKRLNANPDLTLKVYHEMKARRPNDNITVADVAAQLTFLQFRKLV